MDWHDTLRSLLPDDHKPEATGEPSEASEQPGGDYATAQTTRLDIVLERKGRAGKTATIVTGFTIPDAGVSRVAAKLKSALGTGGSARGGEILIQGDRRDDVLRLLAAYGFRARKI